MNACYTWNCKMLKKSDVEVWVCIIGKVLGVGNGKYCTREDSGNK